MESIYSNNDDHFCKALQYLSGAWACFFLASFAGFREYLPAFSRLFEPILQFIPGGPAKSILSLLLQLGNLYFLVTFLQGRFLTLGRLNSPLSLIPLYAITGLFGWIFSDWASHLIQTLPEAQNWIALAALLTFLSVAIQGFWNRLQKGVSSSEVLAWPYWSQVAILLIFAEIIGSFGGGWSKLELLAGVGLIGIYQIYLHQTFRSLKNQELNAYLAAWSLFFSSYGIFIRILKICIILSQSRKRRRS